MADLVLVFDVQAPVLTFHLWGAPPVVRHDLDDGWTATESVTACGLRAERVEWRPLPPPDFGEERLHERAAVSRLRRDHAERIGRLCARCAKANDE
jgi:hypothetical protein